MNKTLEDRVSRLERSNRWLVVACAVLVLLPLLAFTATRVQAVDLLRTKKLELVDDAGRVRASLSVVQNEPQFGLFDETGEPRVGVSAGSLYLWGGTGDAGITLRISSHGSPYLSLSDAAGKSRVRLDATDTETRLTLSDGTTDTPSVMLGLAETGALLTLVEPSGNGAARLLATGSGGALLLTDSDGRDSYAAPLAGGRVLPAGPVLSGYPSLGQKTWIKEKIDSGRMLLLADGSLWEISLLDRINTMLWMMFDDVIVVKGDSPLFPYKLVNTSQGETAEAKYLGKG